VVRRLFVLTSGLLKEQLKTQHSPVGGTDNQYFTTDMCLSYHSVTWPDGQNCFGKVKGF